MPATATRCLLALDGMPAETIVALLDRAEALLPVVRGEAPPRGACAAKVIANVFLEDSTRTRCSFTVAAHRLGARTVDLYGPGSSLSKGETIVDTALNLEAMGVDAMVVRSAAAGGPALVARHVHCPVINGGDGRHEHPTQGLLDLLTLRQVLGPLAGRRLAIVGDILHSRVARSNVHGLTTLGADVLLVGPPPLVPADFERIVAAGAPGSVTVGHDLDAVLGEVDAIMMLRVQFERGSAIAGDYREQYGLHPARAARLREGVPVLHPGPMNRGLEIDGEVADDPRRSVIMRQVTNGVAVRMAVLERALG